ncbi:hypothetical protein DVA86_21190 [Streptomyces armeniacus]|uniref:Integral membrane protein n=1 Tax=Streptomyces armeniacus TaxID=83291 RepID=A0A345XT27_9ACTN|nr:hypothetical protein [Streptomyces armeniacus]AXK34793.1 hypothetical protein DVA86_21190 [Streptomyces armeniacus]
MTAGADLRLLRAAVFTAVCVALSVVGHVFLAGTAFVPLWSLGAGCALVFAVAAPLAGRERSLPGIAAVLALGQVTLHTLFSYGQHAAPQHQAAGGGAGGGGGLRALAAELLCNDGAAAALSESQARQVIAHAGMGDLAGTAGRDLSGGHAAHAGADAAAATGAAAAPDTPAECLRAAVNAAFAQCSAPMLAGHLLAALATGWLLRRGEAALWRLVRISAGAAARAEDLATVRELRTALAYVRALRTGLLPDAPAPHITTGAHDVRVPRSVLLHHGVQRRGPPRAAESLALAA